MTAVFLIEWQPGEAGRQPLRADMTPIDVPRRLTFELRIEWDPRRAGRGSAPVANVLRQPVRVNGRLPADDDQGCMDPKPVSPEPLAMLLPARRAEAIDPMVVLKE